MKNKLKFFIATLILISMTTPVFSLLNPAEIYCKALNYSFITVESNLGDRGYCYFSDTEYCDAWSFLKGSCAPERSYCVLNGFSIKTVKNSSICMEFLTEDCAVCVLDNGTEVEVTELMNLSFVEGSCGDGVCTLGENHHTCPSDCLSGEWDTYCDGIEDGVCDPDCEISEDVDCLPVCGNELCEQNETYENCPVDCGKESVCGNGVCERNETIITCNIDCKKKSTCGNGVCDEKESYQICPEDCKSGHKDFFCDAVNDGRCDPDCKNGEDVDCQIERSSHWWIYSVGILAILFSLILLIRKVRVSKNA